MQNGDEHSAKALIAFDAEINCFNFFNETPYDFALQKCSALAELLGSIGGYGGLDYMADLEYFGSMYGNKMGKGGEEEACPEHERLLDPKVMCMDQLKEEVTGGGHDEEDCSKMPSIPEGRHVRYVLLLVL